MATTYSITITMSPATATGLNTGGYSLYGFKAVSGPGNGTPLVWFKTNTYSVNTAITWTESYQAYTSANTALTANTTITASAAFPIDLGQVLNVTDTTGVGTVAVAPAAPGPPAITISNTTSQPFVCGISQAQGNGSFQPLCAFPLHGHNADEIVPIEQVLLMFATDAVNTGAVVEQSFSEGLLVDLTSANQRAVAFDIDAGWTPQPWAALQPAGTNLIPLLITSGS